MDPVQQALLFFRQYRDYVFPPMGDYLDQAKYGPADPWMDNCAYTPAELEWLHGQDRKNLFPEQPFQAGMQPGRYAMWDYIISGGVSALRPSGDLIARTTAKALTPNRDEPVNTFWLEHMKQAFAFKKDNPYIMDFRQIPEGRRLVEAAHALAHHRCNERLVDTTSTLKLHGRLTEEVLKAASELAIGYATGIPIDVTSRGPDVAMAHGLCVRPTTQLGFDMDLPSLRMPVRHRMTDVVQKHLAYVCAVVQIGYDPARVFNRASTGNWPVDWWSYQPEKVYIAGWETAAYMSMQPIVFSDSMFWRDRKMLGDYACHCRDMMPAPTLAHYLNLGRAMMPAGEQYVDVKKWLDSNECSAMVDTAPPLPCHTCMHLYNDFAGGISPPRGPKPYLKKKMSDAWKLYFKNYASAIKLVKKAKMMMYANPREYRRDSADRRRNFKQIINEMRRRIHVRTKW